MKRLWLAVFFLLPALSWAEMIPPKGLHDPRVRVVDYNALNVFKLITFYGVSTNVEFDKSETIKDVAIGDEQAWKIVPRKDHLFIKPIAEDANTNVTVVTDKRSYQFILTVNNRDQKDKKAWADPNLIYALKFRYPADEAAKLAAAAAQQAQRAKTAAIQSRLEQAGDNPANDNLDYWVAGSYAISPSAARDDGRFIYLTFANNRDMPAVYSVDTKGNESLINTHVANGNTLVIQRLVPHLMLRKGNEVASVVNKSFSLMEGRDNTTGTVSDEVKRLIKGGQ